MDTFVEQIVVKRKGAKDFAIIIGTVIISVLLLLFIFPYVFPFLGMLSALLFIGIGYGIWWLLTSLNIEYEYSITNGDIDIDQIIAKRKRKRIVSVSGAKIESLEPYTIEEYSSRKFERRVIAAPSENVPDLWCFTYRSKKNGHTLVVFQPEQRVLDSLKAGLSILVLRETNKKAAE
ncbi:MAG: DUF6106 family protein [Oscillospiraceae bacterium]|nr:DUF6106 family protein [Oscillospiraceae bacterium]